MEPVELLDRGTNKISHAKAGAFWQLEVAVPQHGRFLHDFEIVQPYFVVGPLAPSERFHARVFDHVAVANAGKQMNVRSHTHGSPRSVRHTKDSSALGFLRDLMKLGDTNLLRIGLDNIEGTSVDDRIELLPGGQAFAAGDLDFDRL